MVEQLNSDGSTNVSCTLKSERRNMVIVYIDVCLKSQSRFDYDNLVSIFPIWGVRLYGQVLCV